MLFREEELENTIEGYTGNSISFKNFLLKTLYINRQILKHVFNENYKDHQLGIIDGLNIDELEILNTELHEFGRKRDASGVRNYIFDERMQNRKLEIIETLLKRRDD